MYEAFSADGSMLPPVAFTSDTSVPLDDYAPLKVFVMEGIRGPGSDSTLRWLDEISPDLPEKGLMIWDDLGGHRNRDVLEELEANNIEPFVLPHASHGLINVCDNSLNALLQHSYYTKDRSSHKNMLLAIRDSYEALEEATVVRYFKHTGIISNDDISDRAWQLAHEGYHPNEEREEHIEDMKRAYREWKLNLRNVPDDVRQPRLEDHV